MRKVLGILLSCVLAVGLFAGCSNTQTENPAQDSGKEEQKLSGSVATDGSTSMEEVINGLGEAFTTENPGVKFTYNPTGSSSGITAVSEGRCDIGLSSRALKDEEAATLTGTTLALDGIAVIVNKNNPVSDLSLEQIAKIYTGEITNWSQVAARTAKSF